MTRRKRLCLLLAVLTLLLALSACGARSKLVLATTGMEPTLNLTLPDTITLPDKERDTVYKCYVDKAYSMALAAALLDMDADIVVAEHIDEARFSHVTSADESIFSLRIFRTHAHSWSRYCKF